MDERAGAAAAAAATERRGNVRERARTWRARRLHADLAPEKLPGEPYTNMNKPTRTPAPGENRGLAVTPRDQRERERRVSEEAAAGGVSASLSPRASRGELT